MTITEGYEWNFGWRNLRIGGNGRHYPKYDKYGEPYSVPQGSYWDPIYGNYLDAQYYLRFNGGVRMRNQLKWEELPSTPLGEKILPDPVWYFKDEQWPGAAGKAWLDLAVFEENDPGEEDAPNYFDYLGANPGFELGTDEWDFVNEPHIIRELSNRGYESSQSGILERYDNPNPLVCGSLLYDSEPMEDINYIDDFTDNNDTWLWVTGRLRTKYADCRRFVSPWQWHLSALEVDDNYDYDEDDGRILGPLNEMMTDMCFPDDYRTRFVWKPQISTANVGEWGWTTRKPYIYDDPDTADAREDVWETPKLYNFWYRPIYIFESENVRHEKKAICEVGD